MQSTIVRAARVGVFHNVVMISNGLKYGRMAEQFRPDGSYDLCRHTSSGPVLCIRGTVQHTSTAAAAKTRNLTATQHLSVRRRVAALHV
jgi:hypothetical protein